MKGRYFNILIINSILPILIGLTIYFFFRGYFNVQVLDVVAYKEVPQWIKYNLPDGLWFYALLSTINILWDNELSKESLIWLIVCALLTYSFECLQFLQIVPGTFDWFDIISYSISLIIFIIIKYYKLLNNKTFKLKES